MRYAVLGTTHFACLENPLGPLGALGPLRHPKINTEDESNTEQYRPQKAYIHIWASGGSNHTYVYGPIYGPQNAYVGTSRLTYMRLWRFHERSTVDRTRLGGWLGGWLRPREAQRGPDRPREAEPG